MQNILIFLIFLYKVDKLLISFFKIFLLSEFYSLKLLFNKNKGYKFLLYRLKINYKIPLKKNGNGKKALAPWGLIYNILKNKFLILKKILIELLNKDYIYANNFPI